MADTALTNGPRNPKYAYCYNKLSSAVSCMPVHSCLQASADMFVLVCLLDGQSPPEWVVHWPWPSAYGEGHGKKYMKDIKFSADIQCIPYIFTKPNVTKATLFSSKTYFFLYVLFLQHIVTLDTLRQPTCLPCYVCSKLQCQLTV